MSLWQYADLLKRINAPRYKGIKDLVVDNGELLSDFSDLDLWDVRNGTKAAATNKRFGTGLKVVSNAGATLEARFVPSDLNKVITAKTISFWVYISDLAKVSNIRLFIDTTDYKVKSRNFSDYALCQGWNHLKFSMDDDADWSIDSGFDINKFMRINIVIFAQGAVQFEIDIANLRVDVATKSKVIFHFSDSYETIYSVAFPKLQSLGIKGSIGILSNPIVVGNANYLTIEQLDGLYSAGWCLFNGTHTHQYFSDLTEAQIRDEIELCKNFLLSNGYVNGLDLFEYPGVLQDITSYRQILLDSGIKAGISRGAATISAPVADLLQLSAVLIYDGNWLSNGKPMVDIGLKCKDTLILNFHDLVGVSATDFNTAVDYIVDRVSPSDIVTFNKWYYGR